MSTNPFPLVPPDPDEVPETQAIAPRPRPSNEEIAAWVILAGLFFFVMFRHLVPGVVGGLVLYLVLDRLSKSLSKRLPGAAARPLALILVTLIAGGLVSFVVFRVLENRIGAWLRPRQTAPDDATVRHLMFTVAAFCALAAPT